MCEIDETMDDDAVHELSMQICRNVFLLQSKCIKRHDGDK